ncbi:hypothetical protein U0070_024009 [Myodes glareolus]|uniref:Uncharacterized protein n=1 Tax=Myodes glareolus TaxID=447135 RepID=A0AAW0H0J3_MYOGA
MRMHRTGPRHRMPCSHIFASGWPRKTPAAAASTDLPGKELREVKRVSVYLHHRALQMPAGVMHQGGCHHRIHWQLEICRKMSSGRPFGCHGVTPGHLDLFPP